MGRDADGIVVGEFGRRRGLPLLSRRFRGVHPLRRYHLTRGDDQQDVADVTERGPVLYEGQGVVAVAVAAAATAVVAATRSPHHDGVD